MATRGFIGNGDKELSILDKYTCRTARAWRKSQTLRVSKNQSWWVNRIKKLCIPKVGARDCQICGMTEGTDIGVTPLICGVHVVWIDGCGNAMSATGVIGVG